MNPFLQFIRSDTYHNFWKFTLSGTLCIGLLVAFSTLLFSVFGNQSDDLSLILFTGSYGVAFGFFAAILGFGIMLFAGKDQAQSDFKKRSVLVGLMLGTLVCLIFFGLFGFNLSGGILVILGIPLIGGIYFFRFFAIRYIYPLLAAKTRSEPAGI